MKNRLQHLKPIFIAIAVYFVAFFSILLSQSIIMAAQYSLFSYDYLNVGNQWNYNLHVTKLEGSPVDLQGTSTMSVTQTENIEGFNTSAVQINWEIPGIVSTAEVIYYNITPEFILQIRHEDDESYTTVRNNDPLEDYPILVHDTDNNQHIGHGEFVGQDKYPPYNTWYGSHDSYITYLGEEQITVPAGTFNCIKVYHYYDWRDDGPDYWKVYSTLWIEPNIGIIKKEISDWDWENSQWLESVYTLELSSWDLNGSESTKGQQFVDEVTRVVEEISSKTIFGSYSDDNVKHLLFFKAGHEKLHKAKFSLILDLDDLAGITQEGQDGWVTYWVDIEIGISVGMNPLPVGAGFASVERSPNIDDPRRTGEVVALSGNVAGANFTRISATEYGFETDSLTYQPNTDFASLTLLSTTWNLHRGEISRDVLIELLGQAFPETSSITSFLSPGQRLYSLMFTLDKLGDIIESGPSSIWRSFTSSDAPVTSGNRLSIRRVYGGISAEHADVTRLENYVQPSIEENGRPSVFYPLRVDFFSDDLQVKNLKVVVKNVPAGWTIESLQKNDQPPLFNKDTYPVDNAETWTLYSTEWHIGCLKSAQKEIVVEFSLYEAKLFGDELLDTVGVAFAFPPVKAAPWIPLLLQAD